MPNKMFLEGRHATLYNSLLIDWERGVVLLLTEPWISELSRLLLLLEDCSIPNRWTGVPSNWTEQRRRNERERAGELRASPANR